MEREPGSAACAVGNTEHTICGGHRAALHLPYSTSACPDPRWPQSKARLPQSPMAGQKKPSSFVFFFFLRKKPSSVTLQTYSLYFLSKILSCSTLNCISCCLSHFLSLGQSTHYLQFRGAGSQAAKA